MKHFGFLLQLVLLVLLIGCRSLSETSRFRLTNGYYKTKNQQGKKELRYVHLKNDTIRSYPVNQKNRQVLDTARAAIVVILRETAAPVNVKYAFQKQTWDFNFQAVLFKFRPSTANIPNQLNTQFNFNIFLGRRADIYRISYKSAPLEGSKRKIDHFGYSFGLFTGFGETPVGPSMTQNNITYAYDGLVWINGIGGIIGVNNFTLGMGVGMDQLMDSNRDVWIYQHKPWVGLLLGVKLN